MYKEKERSITQMKTTFTYGENTHSPTFCDTKEPLFCIRAFNLYDGRVACSGNYHSYSDTKRMTEVIVKLLVAAGKYQDDFLWHTPYYYCSPTCSQVFLLEAQRK